jgi:hypothetical protein
MANGLLGPFLAHPRVALGRLPHLLGVTLVIVVHVLTIIVVPTSICIDDSPFRTCSLTEGASSEGHC